jgi:hypothetical protein
MAYYPKNKIKTDQSTPGDEYIIDSTKENYSGFYYKLYNGEVRTGKFPGDGDNLLLVKLTPTNIPAPTKSLTTTTTPPLYPTDQDYKNGMFNRYFSKKRNEYLFEELTQDQYNTLNDSSNPMFTLYKPFFIKWMLTGDKQTVGNYNFYSIKSAEENDSVLGLNEFLKMDYLKYYK